MQWKKTRITMNTWQDGDFKITENPEADGNERFRLDTFGNDGDITPEYFGSLDAAKRAASILNEVALLKESNADLRRQLDERRQAEQFGRTPPAIPHRAQCDPEAPEDDGRGIPSPVPALAIAGEVFDGIPDEGEDWPDGERVTLGAPSEDDYPSDQPF